MWSEDTKGIRECPAPWHLRDRPLGTGKWAGLAVPGGRRGRRAGALGCKNAPPRCSQTPRWAQGHCPVKSLAPSPHRRTPTPRPAPPGPGTGHACPAEVPTTTLASPTVLPTFFRKNGADSQGCPIPERSEEEGAGPRGHRQDAKPCRSGRGWLSLSLCREHCRRWETWQGQTKSRLNLEGST